MVALLWFVFDRLTKLYFEEYGIDLLDAPGIEGVVELSLVHNFGAAWGSFSGAVVALIVVSVILCVLIAVYAFFASREASLLEMVGLALVFAGGIGNMVDRLIHGYVIDFIAPVFIDFPTFNIADMGITCGTICVLVALAMRLFGKER